MIAQAYYWDEEKTVRIFNRDNKYIADLPLENSTEEEADKSLRAIGFRRRTKWMDREWGKEAKVRFR